MKSNQSVVFLAIIVACSATALAADVALDNEHYRQKYSVDNPNLDSIRKLRNAGVDVAVCGQAAAEHRDHYEWIALEVTLALSALTTITTLEHQGYVLMPL
jgi:intracellular sulfur oxidation DsrE/DsrF family protein